MDNLVCMQHFQASKKIMRHLPYKIFIELLILLSLLCDHSLHKIKNTARSPPSAYSITMQRVALVLSKKAVWQEITLGELIDARSRISFKAESFYLSERLAILICLIATYYLSPLRLLAFITLPKLPLPNSFIVQYSSIEENIYTSILQSYFLILKTFFFRSINKSLFLVQQYRTTVMLRKKNYKDEDHFSHYYSVAIPRSNGSKLTLYYKRYRPAKTAATLHQVLHGSTKPQTQSLYPIDRTLEAISFDGKLDIALPLFKKIGKVRKFLSGQTQYAGKQAHYCVVIFKFEFDLVKCFRQEYFQELVNRESDGHADEEDREAYRTELIAEQMRPQLGQLGKLQELQREGYNVVTNKLGEFTFDYEANQKTIQDLPQVKRRRKQEARALAKQ